MPLFGGQESHTPMGHLAPLGTLTFYIPRPHFPIAVLPRGELTASVGHQYADIAGHTSAVPQVIVALAQFIFRRGHHNAVGCLTLSLYAFIFRFVHPRESRLRHIHNTGIHTMLYTQRAYTQLRPHLNGQKKQQKEEVFNNFHAQIYIFFVIFLFPKDILEQKYEIIMDFCSLNRIFVCEIKRIMKQIEVVAAIIHDAEGRIFATQRGYGEWKDWWEFPGGKMESGETPEEALRREIWEELETKIVIERLVSTVEYDYPAFHLKMHCFLCSLQAETLHLNEHEAARWLSKEELGSVNWLPADLQVLETLKEN